MKILLSISDVSTFGGAERVVVNLANALSDKHEVTLLSFYKKNENLAFDILPQVRLLFLNACAEEQKKKSKNIFYNFYFKNLYKIFISYKIKKEYKDTDIIISNFFAFIPYFKNKNTLYIKLEHSRFERYFSRNKLFDFLVVLSSSELSTWKQNYPKVEVIPNFIPKIPKQNLNTNQKQVLAVGRLSKEKGFNRLVKIWNLLSKDETFKQEFKQWKLVIVGDGEQKQALQEKIKKLNLEKNIILKAFTKEIEKEYLHSSIYVMSSYYEGFGMVLAEASSFALPCIAFDVKTGPSDLIESEKTGFLIQDDDLQDFAEKLKLLMSDENLRETFGKNAKEKMKKEFSKEVVMKKWEELFKDLKA